MQQQVGAVEAILEAGYCASEGASHALSEGEEFQAEGTENKTALRQALVCHFSKDSKEDGMAEEAVGRSRRRGRQR